MAKESKKGGSDEESGEFAEFLADISQEIAQRVESLDTKPKAPRPETKKTPIAPDAGLIVEWPNIADRMIEEMR
ncbi:MAG TPA: hypothetical protein VF836_06550 [Gemmatimonadaceae bacterium]